MFNKETLKEMLQRWYLAVLLSMAYNILVMNFRSEFLSFPTFMRVVLLICFLSLPSANISGTLLAKSVTYIGVVWLIARQIFGTFKTKPYVKIFLFPIQGFI